MAVQTNSYFLPDIKDPQYGADKDDETVYLTPNTLGKLPWSVMKAELPSDENAKFQGIPVLCSG